MTLLITVVTQQAIYQSADFRLTDLNSGGLITDESSKLISLQYEGWSGFVAYTGIGRWKGRDTRDYLVDWLREFPATGVNDITERIRSMGTAWLGEIEKGTKKRQRHTFILAAFEAGKPIVAVVSNFENAYERNDKYPSENLTTTTRRFGNNPMVVVCGWRQAVKRHSRTQLERVARQAPSDPARFRILLANINAESARNADAKNLISPNCSVMSLRPDGQGVVNVEGKIDVRCIVFGIVSPSLNEIVRLMQTSVGGPDFSNVRLIGAAFASSGQRVPYEPCQPKIIKPSDAHGFTLRELAIKDLPSCMALDVNDTGVVLGQGNRHERRDLDVPWTLAGDDVLLWRPDETERSVHIRAINNSGQMAMETHTVESKIQASRWAGSSQFMLEPCLVSADSGAESINNNGTVVGWVSIDPAKKGQGSHRPAAWRAHKLINFPNFQGDWGYASDINDGELAIGLIYVRGRPHAFLWDLNDGNWWEIPGRPSVIPHAISSNGVVLGNLNLSNGSTLALTSNKDEGWKPLTTPPGYYATALTTAGDVAGYSKQDGYLRPWFRRANGETILLPYFEFHNCKPTAINASSVIVGSAMTDHGSHALLWSPSDNPTL